MIRSYEGQMRPRFYPQSLETEFSHTTGVHFAAVAAGAGIDVVTTPLQAPRANAVCERFIGSVRRECLDWLLIWGEGHLRRVLRAYSEYFNTQRPHQGLNQRVPMASTPGATPSPSGRLVACPILGGLHHAYEWAA